MYDMSPWSHMYDMRSKNPHMYDMSPWSHMYDMRSKNPHMYDMSPWSHMYDMIPIEHSKRTFSEDIFWFINRLCKIKWEVVSVTFMHNFHTEICTVNNISPRVDKMTA